MDKPVLSDSSKDFFSFSALHFNVINRITVLPAEEREIFGAVVTLAIAAGFALSLQLRCIMILVLPNFFGRHGRSMLASVVFVLLLAGKSVYFRLAT